MKTALIFGSSGLVGNQLFNIIIQNNNYHHIKLFVRSESKNNNSKVEIFQIFCAISRSYGVANIVKKSGSKVPGGIWEISINDEKELDYYEGFPMKYTKDFFKLNGGKAMFYIMKRQHSFKPPLRQYVDIINQGYQDCNLDREYLKKRLNHYNIEL